MRIRLEVQEDGSWGVKALESDNGLDLIFLLKSDYLPKHKKLTLGGLIGFLKEEGFLGETVNEIDFSMIIPPSRSQNFIQNGRKQES